ncbi:hydroxysqualene dehydroxylase HpnE [Stieleria sp. TO1_6]|uniref:hydroxysqualene dehydroxylase HpnE n=1 Tax=Stieleria tagensis TaxID=2956795 RepID=UPI00209A7432|nr:hydroxysqualene dehydroxylase HpnE [Stieleria tagensis]MCO8124918.1 hydroxysqualene dehydroxylase HpnE [Stieleria tagensis]
MQRVVIVGAGIAGLSAAEALSRVAPWLSITLLESKRVPGGRAGSFHDRDQTDPVDYCQHVAMGCCTNFIDMIRQTGLQDQFRCDSELTFLYPDQPPSRFVASRWLPPPLHLLASLDAQRYLTAAEKRQIKRGLWNLMRTSTSSLNDCVAADWLDRYGQSSGCRKKFWDVILVSALGEKTEHVSMAAARKVLIDGFAAARGASDVWIPISPLATVFGRRMQQCLVDRGVDVRCGRPVRQITADATVILADDGPETDDVISADHVICAVPWHQLHKLFDRWPAAERKRLPDLESIANIPSSPISGLHLWFDRPITDLPHAVMVGTTVQWVFRRPHDAGREYDSHYIQCVISAAADLTRFSKQQLVDHVIAELRHAFPRAREALLKQHRVVTDPNSVFSIGPDVDAIRPPTQTAFDWLTLAGDWTQTQWPATMEGAVISGRRAAEHILESCQDQHPANAATNAPVVCPGLPRGRLARLLIRT